MKNVFEKLNHLSYPTVLFVASLLTVASVLPLWLYITGQQTQLSTKAKEQRSVETIIAKPTDGPVPANPPAITRVVPWIGKTGDVVIIEGNNFGVYPKNRRLAIGDGIVSDSAISLWSDTQIVATIPPDPKQGMPISLRIDTYPIVESLPLTFYDENVTLRLHKTGQTITLTGATGTIKTTLYTQNRKQDRIISGYTQSASSSSEPQTLFTLAPNETIQSLLIMNENNDILPYSLNPTEFGF